MSFFGRIGKGIKKFAKKNIRFKTLVKGVSQFGGMIPLPGADMISGMIGQMADKREAKKQEKAMLKQMEKEQAQQMAQMSNTEKVDALNQAMLARTANVGIKDVLNGALGGALSGAGNALAGDTTTVNATSTLADNTISATLKKNWPKYLGYLAVGVLFVVGLVKLVFKPKKSSFRRR
jgi:hypothetical protein